MNEESEAGTKILQRSFFGVKKFFSEAFKLMSINADNRSNVENSDISNSFSLTNTITNLDTRLPDHLNLLKNIEFNQLLEMYNQEVQKNVESEICQQKTYNQLQELINESRILVSDIELYSKKCKQPLEKPNRYLKNMKTYNREIRKITRSFEKLSTSICALVEDAEKYFSLFQKNFESKITTDMALLSSYKLKFLKSVITQKTHAMALDNTHHLTDTTKKELENIGQRIKIFYKELKEIKPYFNKSYTLEKYYKAFKQGESGDHKKLKTLILRSVILEQKTKELISVVTNIKQAMFEQLKEELKLFARLRSFLKKTHKLKVENELDYDEYSIRAKIYDQIKSSIQNSSFKKNIHSINGNLSYFKSRVQFYGYNQAEIEKDMIRLFRLYNLKNRLVKKLLDSGLSLKAIKRIKKEFKREDILTEDSKKFNSNHKTSVSLIITQNKIFEILNKYSNIKVDQNVFNNYIFFYEIKELLKKAKEKSTAINKNETSSTTTPISWNKADLNDCLDLNKKDTEENLKINSHLSQMIEHNDKKLYIHTILIHIFDKIYHKSFKAKRKMHHKVKKSENKYNKTAKKISFHLNMSKESLRKLDYINKVGEELRSKISQFFMEDLHEKLEMYSNVYKKAKKLKNYV